jgi:hypothetical protein
MELYQDGFKRRTDTLAERLRDGEITAAQWELAMRDEIRDLHVGTLVVAHGGDRGSITQAEWGRLGAYIKEQYKYLHGFAQTVEKSAVASLTGQGEFVSLEYLSWRSNLYAGSAKASFWRGKTQGMLPQVPGDGQTQCGTNCGCHLRFEEGEQDWIMYVWWELGPTEHCPDCLALAAEWSPYTLELPAGLSAREAVHWLGNGAGLQVDIADAIGWQIKQLEETEEQGGGD